MILLLAAACDLFDFDALVDCVEGMACAGGDSDTGLAPGAPRRGYVVSFDDGAGSYVAAFGPDGAELARWSDMGGRSGQVAYLASMGAGLVATEEEVLFLRGDGTSFSIPLEGAEVTDLASYGGGFVVAVNDAEQGLLAYLDALVGEPTELYGSADESFLSVATAGDVGFALGRSGAPDLFRISAGPSAAIDLSGFDVGYARAENVAVGPQGEAWVCSSAGALYPVQALREGDTTPRVVYSAYKVDDVGACAWDDGDERWLLYSPTVGVIRVDDAGRAQTVYPRDPQVPIADVAFY